MSKAIDALKELSVRLPTWSRFEMAILTGWLDSYEVSEAELKEALNLKANEHQENKEKLKKFYFTTGRQERRNRRQEKQRQKEEFADGFIEYCNENNIQLGVPRETILKYV